MATSICGEPCSNSKAAPPPQYSVTMRSGRESRHTPYNWTSRHTTEGGGSWSFQNVARHENESNNVFWEWFLFEMFILITISLPLKPPKTQLSMICHTIQHTTAQIFEVGKNAKLQDFRVWPWSKNLKDCPFNLWKRLSVLDKTRALWEQTAKHDKPQQYIHV